jgi:hypothetical protein
VRNKGRHIWGCAQHFVWDSLGQQSEAHLGGDEMEGCRMSGALGTSEGTAWRSILTDAAELTQLFFQKLVCCVIKRAVERCNKVCGHKKWSCRTVASQVSPPAASLAANHNVNWAQTVHHTLLSARVASLACTLWFPSSPLLVGISRNTPDGRQCTCTTAGHTQTIHPPICAFSQSKVALPIDLLNCRELSCGLKDCPSQI